MSHDPTKLLLGSTNSTVKEVTCEDADPASFPAGTAVRRASNGGLQIADDSTASLIGVSLGQSLSDTKKTAVIRTGNFVNILVQNDAASVKKGDITFTAKLFGPAGNALTIALIDDGAVSVEVIDNDIVVNIDAGVTTAAQIKAAIEANAEANALITATIDSGDEAAAQSAQTEASLTGGSDFCVPGTAVKIDDTTGLASVDGDTTAAIYLTGTLTGVKPDGTTAPAAMIAMPGGF